MTKKKLFIVAGLPRAGTTFLYFQLQQHPDIFAPVRKETNYFSVAYDRGMEWYHKLFEGIQHDQLGMDVTPAYSLDPVSIERIKDYDPDIKVIMGIRKPSKLVCSFYDQVNSHSYQVEDFTDFMHHHDWKISGKIIPLPFSEGWIGQCIRQWQEAFGDQLLLYDFELLGKQPLVV
ncbi:MAG: sulfotransferase domain-containing protein, partial [Bacteroidota bacterium]